MTLWTIAQQFPLSLGFSRQEHWSGCHFLFPGHLPDAGIKLVSPVLQADSIALNHQGNPCGPSLKSNEGDVYAYNYNKMSQTSMVEKYQCLISDKTHRKCRTQIVRVRDVFKTRVH